MKNGRMKPNVHLIAILSGILAYQGKSMNKWPNYSESYL
jgi:hypothetical protein